MEKRTLFTAIVVVLNPVSEVLCMDMVLQSVCCICLKILLCTCRLHIVLSVRSDLESAG